MPNPGASPDVVRDPTENVLDLVEAAVARLNDLGKLRAEHMRELLDRDRAHAAELRALEAARLDAIRAVDVGAVQRAAEVQAQVANALASQVATSADAFRVALSAQLEPLQRDIADLRKTQYEQAGQKAQVGESRLNVGAILGAVSVLLVLIFGVASLWATSR